MRGSVRAVVASATVALVLGISGGTLDAQQPRSQSVTAAGAALGAWATRADVMLREGTLALTRVDADSMISGRNHEHLSQRHAGLRVYGGELIRQMNGRVVESVFGCLFDNVSVPTLTPAIGAADAAALAANAAGEGAIPGDIELGILPTADAFSLVYQTLVRSPWDIRTYYVDAMTGAIVDEVSRIKHQQRPSVGIGSGILKDQKKVSAAQTGSTFQTIDLMRPATGFTLDFRGSVSRFNAFLQTGDVFLSDVATSSSQTWNDPVVVDAHVYQGWVYDYYFKRFGRRGIDDQDLEVVGIVHPLARHDAPTLPPEIVGVFVNNAAYLGDGFMVYGDGDGVVFDYLAGALDVVAHELTHGVTEFTSQLGSRNEPGALNEAFSDIMAAGVEAFHLTAGQGPQQGPNFLLAEDVTRFGPGYIRSMSDPNANGNPDHYSLRQMGTFDRGGVHINSTIVSHAFYLAVVGGTNRVSGITVQGIGLANMARMEGIFYRAFTTKLTSRAQFTDARAATLQAATELFGAGSVERAQLLQAWTAVGVP